jgi:hypothetical protein
MKAISFVAGGLVLVLVVVAVIGAMLPRTHKASRTLRVNRPPADVWPVVMQTTQASEVPVDVLESEAPHRLVTRVTEKETNFGGTWTIAIDPAPTSGAVVTITEDGWVANPIFRFVSRVVIGHHATMDATLRKIAATLNEEAALSGE